MANRNYAKEWTGSARGLQEREWVYFNPLTLRHVESHYHWHPTPEHMDRSVGNIFWITCYHCTKGHPCERVLALTATRLSPRIKEWLEKQHG